MGRNLKKRIPNLLKKYRRVRGFSQREVARILELESTSMISRWESGLMLPSAINLFKLAALYRVMVDALYFDFLGSIKEELKAKEEMVFGSR
jgi:transcriptional regulator with XRE-family HTH domain